MTSKTLVWDLPIRIFHWLLVAAIAGAWYTAEEGYEDTHMKIGYAIIGLLIYRIVWGIFGTEHSLFRSFIPSPFKLYQHTKNIFKVDAKQSVGHNPLGALSALIMLFLIGLQAATGLFTKGEIWYGPYTSAVGSELQKRLDGIHHANFDFILVALGVHIVAIFFYLFFKKQNLITPMIHGKKNDEVVPNGKGIPHSKLLVAVILALVVAAFTYWLCFISPPEVIYDDYY